MGNSRKDHFESRTATASESAGDPAIWELPDHVLDDVSGALDFSQGSGPGHDFAQNFSCFAQGIGDFSSGTPPWKVPKEIEGDG